MAMSSSITTRETTISAPQTAKLLAATAIGAAGGTTGGAQVQPDINNRRLQKRLSQVAAVAVVPGAPVKVARAAARYRHPPLSSSSRTSTSTGTSSRQFYCICGRTAGLRRQEQVEEWN